MTTAAFKPDVFASALREKYNTNKFVSDLHSGGGVVLLRIRITANRSKT